MRHNKSGFTLIELLIVVAIIAILAAIAIPNFLAAQIRAKVSRVKGEMRSLAIGIEAYHVDNNTYLQDWLANSPVDFGAAYQITYHQELSTPVAYMTSVSFLDPFGGNAKDDFGKPIAYRYFGYKKLGGGAAFNWGDLMGSNEIDHNAYVLMSAGPDAPTGSPIPGQWIGYDGGEWYDRMPLAINPTADYEMGRIYDPTNGTVSNGDVIRLGGEHFNPQP